MVKAYYNRWKINQANKASQDNVGAAALELRMILFKNSTSAEEFHAADILKTVKSRTPGSVMYPAA